jgi:hypothetical protein
MDIRLNGEGFLLALARIALTFVGFAAVVSLLRHRGREWLPQEVRGLKLMFEFDLAATLFALLPFPLVYALGSEREPLVWRIATSLLACYMTTALWRHYRAHRLGNPRPRHPAIFRWMFTFPMILLVSLESVSAIVRPGLAAYSWGLYWLLIPPIIQFSIFIAHFGESNAVPPGSEVRASAKVATPQANRHRAEESQRSADAESSAESEQEEGIQGKRQALP